MISTNTITIKTTNKYSVITVCNFDNYQEANSSFDKQNDNQNDNQTTNEQQTNDNQTTTNKNDKNNILTHIHVCTHEADLGLNDCYCLLLNDTSWTDVFCMNNHLTPKQFAEYLKIFFSELENRGETMKVEKDAKFHFSNWYNLNKNKLNGTKDRNADKADKARSLLTEYSEINCGNKQSPSDSEILNF